MNAGVGTAPDCLSLAIAFHQAPSRFPDLLHGRAPLPDHVGVLLRLAGGAPLDADAPVAPPLIAPEEVKSAAQFFVEQVLLAHDADHYRVLGVSPGASLEEIREHHRLLMRIFHPDRGDNLGGAKDAIATRINLAYSALRDPTERAAYDLEKRLATKKAVTPHIGELRRTARMEPPGHGLPPFLARNLPQFVLGATALAAVAVVGWIYLNRQPVGAIGGGEGEVERIAYRKPPPAVQEEPAAPRLSLTQPVSQVEAAPPNVETPPQPVVEPPRQPQPAEPPRQLQPAEPAIKPAAEVIPARAEPAPAPKPRPKFENVVAAATPPVAAVKPAAAEPKPAPAEPKPAATEPATTSIPQAAASAPPTPAIAPPPVVVASVAPPPPKSIGLEDLSALVAQLSARYERGDLEGFLALFDEAARIEGGDKARIRSDYEELFRTTDMRQLRISDMKWVTDGALLRGKGSFQAKVVRKGEDVVRSYTGTIRLDAAPAGGTVRLRGMYH